MPYSDELTPEDLPTAVRVLPTCICLDTSLTMAVDGKIDSLNRAVKHFVEAVRNHRTASKAVRWEFVTFPGLGGHDFTDHLGHFVRAGDAGDDPLELVAGKLVAAGNTPMAEAIEHALVLLDDEIADHAEAGTKMYKPWLVLMTDGRPSSDPAYMNRVIEQVRARAGGDRARLMVITVGIGPDANREFLQRLSPAREPDMISDADIESYFDHLSKLVIRSSEGATTVAEAFSSTIGEQGEHGEHGDYPAPSAPASAYNTMRCGTSKRLFVARFVQQGQQWNLTSLSPLAEGVKDGTGGERLEGSFGTADGYPGCPDCGNRSYVRCGACGALTCWSGQPSSFACAACGNGGTVTVGLSDLSMTDLG